MKRMSVILLFLFSTHVFAQQPWYKGSPVNYAWKNVGSAGFTEGPAIYTCIAISPSGEPYVAYADHNYDDAVSVMKFDGKNWVYVGNPGFSTVFPEYISLAFCPSDSLPYLAYDDDLAVTVMKFNGTNWENYGNPRFSSDIAEYISLAFSPLNHQPYVAYQDYGNSQKATVMTFNGTEWVNVGNAGFSATEATDEKIAFNPADGQPYVAYESGTATVMKFNGTSWVNVGNANFSGESMYMSLAFNPWNDRPYVAYEDFLNSLKASVMTFDGTDWVNVGSAGFTSGRAQEEMLAFNPTDGEPYVIFQDESGFATVMKFNGTSWLYVGNAGFSPGVVYSPGIAFSPTDNKPYVVFEDAISGLASVMKYDSAMVGIHEFKETKFSLYPNPTNDKATVEIAEGQAPGNLFIMNLNGEQVLKTRLIASKTQIDISSLPVGVYIVRLINDQKVEMGKIIKQ